ncbi:MAG: hypothetical protein D6B26_00335, partial [Spirochaetaceae bacterium]
MKKSYGSVFLLQLSLGVMFVMLGIAGISGATEGLGGFTNDLDKMFGGNNGTIEVVIASIKLIAGGLLLLSLFS